MKKILLIGTGGTIASQLTADGLAPELTSEQLLAQIPSISEICRVESVQLLNLDSTNIAPKHWLRMVRCIRKHYKDYDGFVLTHGTDTMAYTAAALSYLIQQSPKPIVLTGAQKPIGFDVTDEVFGIAIAQEGILNIWYFIGAMCAAIPGWSLGTLFGALAGNVLPVWAMNGFSVMLYGMFLAIIMPEGKKNRVVLGCIGVSFVLSGLAARLLPTLSSGMRILLLTIFISAAAAILFPRENPDVDTKTASGEEAHAA